MSRVGLVVHPGREAAVAAASALAEVLGTAGVSVVELGSDPSEASPDLVVSIGGDGTFLRGAREAAIAGCPVLGVKVGRLGFLTEVEPPEAAGVIEQALAGRAGIEERLAVVAQPLAGGSFEPEWGLNEVMVEKSARHRLVRLATWVDGVYVTNFSADGVVVATPTGSTAYSFSAHGPIVSPGVACLIMSPIAAHMVFDRSLVVGPGQQIVFEVLGDEPGLVSVDGRRGIEVPVGCRLKVGAADRPVRLVRKDDAPPFLTRVREKFDLPGDPPGGADGAHPSR